MQSLLELQRELAAALLAPTPRSVDGLGWEGVRAEASLAVYRNHVRQSLCRAIRDTFPVTRALVGEDYFTTLAVSFVRAKPPRESSLAAYGEEFLPFLKLHPTARALPYLVDVARLEWLRHASASAGSEEPLDLAALAKMPPGVLAKLRVARHPAAFAMRSRWPVFTIWQAHQSPSGGPAEQIRLDAGAETTLVVRPGLQVRALLAEHATKLMLDALRKSRSLAELLERTGSRVPPARLGTALQQLLETGALVRVQ